MKKLFLILALLLVAIVAFAQHIDAKKFILNCSQSWGVTSEQIVQTNGQALTIKWLQWGSKLKIDIHCFVYKINDNLFECYDFYNDRLVGIEYDFIGDSVDEQVRAAVIQFGAPDLQIKEMKASYWIFSENNTIFTISHDKTNLFLDLVGIHDMTGVTCMSIDCFKEIFQ